MIKPNTTDHTGRGRAVEVVLFDFDKDAVKEEYSLLLGLIAVAMTRNPALILEIEGHTDPRGSCEYNLALGQRRADSVKREICKHCTDPSRIRTVSYGKEYAKGVDEASWAWDRTVYILFLGP